MWLCRYDPVPPPIPGEPGFFYFLSDTDQSNGDTVTCHQISDRTSLRIAYVLGRIAEKLRRIWFP